MSWLDNNISGCPGHNVIVISRPIADGLSAQERAKLMDLSERVTILEGGAMPDQEGEQLTITEAIERLRTRDESLAADIQTVATALDNIELDYKIVVDGNELKLLLGENEKSVITLPEGVKSVSTEIRDDKKLYVTVNDTTSEGVELFTEIENGSITKSKLAADVYEGIATKTDINNLAEVIEEKADKVLVKTVSEADLDKCTDGNYIVEGNGVLTATKYSEDKIKQVWTTAESVKTRICTFIEESADTNLVIKKKLADGTYSTHTYTDADVVDGYITLPGETTYIISGTATKCSLCFKVNRIPAIGEKIKKTKVHLAGLRLYAEGPSGIVYDVPTSDSIDYNALELTIDAGTENQIYCTTVTGADGEKGNEDPAAIWSKKDLEICGCGYLTVFNNYGGHGIKATDIRFKDAVNVYIHAIHDAIHPGSRGIIENGNFIIDGCNDCIGTGNDGIIHVHRGNFVLKNFKDNAFDARYNGIIEGNTTIKTDRNLNLNNVDLIEGVTLTGDNSIIIRSLEDYYGPATVVPVSGNQPALNYVGGKGKRVFNTADGIYILRGYFKQQLEVTQKATLILDGACIDVSDCDAVVYTNASSRLKLDSGLKEKDCMGEDSDYYQHYGQIGLKPSTKSNYIIVRDTEEEDVPSGAYSKSGNKTCVGINSTNNLEIGGATNALYIKTPQYATYSSDSNWKGDCAKYIEGEIVGTGIFFGKEKDADPATAGDADGSIYTTNVHARVNGSGEKANVVIFEQQKGSVVIDKLEIEQSTNIKDQSKIVPTITKHFTNFSDTGFYVSEVLDGNNEDIEYSELKLGLTPKQPSLAVRKSLGGTWKTFLLEDSESESLDAKIAAAVAAAQASCNEKIAALVARVAQLEENQGLEPPVSNPATLSTDGDLSITDATLADGTLKLKNATLNSGVLKL